MSRFHVHIAVEALDENIRFYSAVFGCEPVVRKHDYAKWSLVNPAVNFAISARGRRAGLDHIGIQADNARNWPLSASVWRPPRFRVRHRRPLPAVMPSQTNIGCGIRKASPGKLFTP